MALTFRKLNDVLAADGIPLIRANVFQIDNQMFFPEAVGNVADGSHLLVNADGYLGIGPPDDIVIYTATESIDVPISGTPVDMLQGVTVADFATATETGAWEFRGFVRNSHNSQSRTLTLEYVDDGVPSGDPTTLDIPAGDTPVLLSGSINTDVALGSTVAIRATGPTDLSILGTISATVFRMVKAA